MRREPTDRCQSWKRHASPLVRTVVGQILPHLMTRPIIPLGFALASSILIAGAIWQGAASNAALRRYPPPGILVRVRGGNVHLNCSGQGGPTVIMDAALGSFSLEWAAVQPEVARVTRACSFDRPGMGWSEVAAPPRDSQRIVSELHDLLAAAGLKPPYVLVGHSFGGLNVRLFASEYLPEIAGLVLVESSHEDQVRLLPRPPAWKSAMRRAVLASSALGLPRLLYSRLAASMPGSGSEVQRALTCTTRSLRTVASELDSFETSLDQVRSRRRSLGDLPLVVISRADTDGPTSSTWDAMQRDTLNLSTNAVQVIARHSGHYVPIEEPTVVIDAVERLVSCARGADRDCFSGWSSASGK
jgi:pimeloyl-ACP methyl ester carboxylesterase